MNDITQLSTLYSNAIDRAEKAEEALRKSEWQPIDTAPTSNGSVAFLAFIPGHGQCVCARSVLGRVYSISGGRVVHKATHWTHLPSPPPVRETP